MREEVHEMSRQKRSVLYQKRAKEFERVQVILSILISIVGLLAARQFILLDVAVEMLPIGKKGLVYLGVIVTLAGLQLSTRFGHHIFKTTPWMIEFSQNKGENGIDNIEESEKPNEN